LVDYKIDIHWVNRRDEFIKAFIKDAIDRLLLAQTLRAVPFAERTCSQALDFDQSF
jgi:hypothetical protein